jgi:hypothetical protein
VGEAGDRTRDRDPPFIGIGGKQRVLPSSPIDAAGVNAYPVPEPDDYGGVAGMGGTLSWLEKKQRIRNDLAAVFAGRTGISVGDFLDIFFDPERPPTIGDFAAQYVPDRDTLTGILLELAERTGLDLERIRSHYYRKESFAQFGEHLLRAGAYG